MEKKYLIQLMINLYQLTSLFPKKEPLRFKIRELADDIFQNLILIFRANPLKSSNLISEVEKKLEVLDGLLEIAKAQNWVSPSEILKAQQEHSRINEELKKLLEIKSPREIYQAPSQTVVSRKISSRQEKILSLLKEEERLQVKDLKEVFPQVSKRTLRRDFEQLLKKGLVLRIGEKNNTSYIRNRKN